MDIMNIKLKRLHTNIRSKKLDKVDTLRNEYE